MLSAEQSLDLLNRAARWAGLPAPIVELPQDETFRANGLSLHYLDWGRPRSDRPGLTVLFLHGGGLNAHSWDLICGSLAGEFHVLALDQRGHGDSDWSKDGLYEPEHHANDIEALLEHVGSDEVVVVGHSMGGLNATAYAARRPAGLRGLILVESGPNPREDGARRILDFMAGPDELDSIGDFVQRAMLLRPNADPELLRRSLSYSIRQLENGKWTWKYDSHFRRMRRDAERQQRWEECATNLRKITCPTLFVLGGRSDVFNEEDATRVVSLLSAGDWTTVADAGHNIHSDNPAGLLSTVRRFLAAV